MTVTLTENDRKFIKGMEAAVAERGEHYLYPQREGGPDGVSYLDYWSYGACVYSTPDGTPACIVGLAIAKSGIGEVPNYGFASEASGVLINMDISDVVSRAADRAQLRQDDGSEWGVALDTFKENLMKDGVDLGSI